MPQTGSLDTKVFFKPIDTHELFHKSSYHSYHPFKGIAKSQIIQFHRICSSISDFDNAIGCFQKEVQLSSGFAYIATKKLAELHTKKFDYDKALEYYREVIR